MDQFVDFQNDLKSYIDKLLADEQYSELVINSVVLNNGDSGNPISINSNARVRLSGSLRAETQISEYVSKQIKKYGQLNNIVINLDFQKKEIGNMSNPNGHVVSAFRPIDPKYQLDDVILPTETKESITDALSIVENYELIFNTWGWKKKEPSAKTIICFYGEPGTGKTMCAHAVADYLHKKIMVASYADIQSEYVGVGPKNLKAIFEEAEKCDAVLFFDEADSFLRKRTSDTSSSASMHYNSMTNEMMKHLEEFNGVVIFATNLTENTDEAFKTRISCSVNFKAPDQSTRAKIISQMIPSQLPLQRPFEEQDFIAIAEKCDGFVGRDIRNAIKKVITEGAKHQKYPFSLEDFINGFESYKDNKDELSASISGGNGKMNAISPYELFTENENILALATYTAWMDGDESEREAELLKEMAKILVKNKLNINKLSDLPSLAEICDGIKHSQSKKNALVYVSRIATLFEDEQLATTVFESVLNQFEASQLKDLILNLHRQQRKVNEIEETIAKELDALGLSNRISNR